MREALGSIPSVSISFLLLGSIGTKGNTNLFLNTAFAIFSFKKSIRRLAIPRLDGQERKPTRADILSSVFVSVQSVVCVMALLCKLTWLVLG